MFAGHIGAALALGRAEPRIPPGVMVSAALLPDLLLWGFILVGWESATLPDNIAITHQPEFVFPYSHGLVAALAWSALAGGAVLMWGRSWGASRWRAAVLVALAVGSHWVLDALVHVAELPLAGAGSPRVGLGLWRHMPRALVLEGGLTLSGLWLYLAASPLSTVRKSWLTVLCLAVLLFTILGMTVSPPPASVNAMAAGSLVAIVGVGALAGWIGGRGLNQQQDSTRASSKLFGASWPCDPRRGFRTASTSPRATSQGTKERSCLRRGDTGQLSHPPQPPTGVFGNSPKGPSMPRVLIWCLRIAGILAAAVVILALVVLLALTSSRARLGGSARIPSLGGDVVVDRDDHGVPTIQASSQADAIRALGFLHGQERFFQMDLLRRTGAGDLAALFGAAVLDMDLLARRHDVRGHMTTALRTLDSAERSLLEAYAEGVNAGLGSLRVRPPEYLLLRLTPQPWQPEDSLAVMAAMAFALQDPDGSQEAMLGVMHRTLSPAAFAFFAPRGTQWDAALDGSEFPAPPIPAPEEFTAPAPPPGPIASAVGIPGRDEAIPGSNGWAVGGARTSHGGALVADDMHLELRMPNYWYRAVIRWNGEGGRPRQLAGVTLPGMPYLVTGSNGDVAWAFTNAQVDETDVIELETDPARPGRYRTPAGWKEFTVRSEEIPIAGGPSRRIVFTNTIWGPVVDLGIQDGRVRVSRWVYEEPDAWQVRYSPLLRATNVAEALTLAPRNPIPVQNFVTGDRAGNIGWTLMGPLPRRVGWDGRLPSAWSDGSHRWAGLKSVPDYPRVFNPPEGLIWTANQRVDGGSAYVDAGDGFPDNGARARQIRDGLRSLTKATPADLLAIQLDDRGVFLDRWQHLLLKTLEHPTGTNGTAFAAARTRVEAWGGRAVPESVGFRLVSGFRDQVERRVAEPVVIQCRAQCPNFFIPGSQFEQPLWALVQERPAHLLNRRYTSWESLLEDAAAATVDAAQRHPGGMAAFTWGDRQRFQMKHPLSLAVPALGRWLDLPAEELPGAPSAMPRIQGRGFGASERFSVGPGWESDGLFQMPGGQSGHFLSPYYRLGHEDWAQGRPKPFLAGASQNRLVLSPR